MAKFTDRYIINLKPEAKKYKRTDAKGFVLQVLPSGTKTFLFIYQQNNKRKQINIGNYPAVTLEDARAEYNRLLMALKRGEPLTPKIEEPPTPDKTIHDLVQEFQNFCTQKNHSRSWIYTKEKVYQKHLGPWMQRPVSSITKQEALALLQNIQKHSRARNALKMFKVLFAYAVDHDIIEASPFDRLEKRLPNMEEPIKTRTLNEDEIRHLWKALQEAKINDSFRRILQLILVTAQRPGEVAKLHRKEIEGDWWTIPPERALKGRRHHRVYLTVTAKELIGDAEGVIFKSVRTPNSVTTLSVAVLVAYHKCFGLPKWTPHDLRRTARTHMSRIGVPREHAEAVLNHAKGGMIKVYDQYEYDLEKKEALLRWEKELLRIIG